MKMMNLKSGTRIEPLESRIAPAVLVNGANLLGGGHSDSGYTSIGGNAVTLVKVTSGEALVWFDASTQEITGISVANGTKLDITGNVYGDIVANLTSSGHLTDSDNNAANGYDGDVLLANNILGITTHALSGENGDIGRIITGGSISHLSINGQISGIYAGDGVYRSESLATTGSGSSLAVDVTVGLDVNIVQGGIQSGFSFLKSAAVFASGASIKTVEVQTGNELQIVAGDGITAGGSGGNVSGITVHSAFTSDSAIPSYSIYAGDGADGTKGGSGGSISSVTETNAAGIVDIVAGNGGNGTAGAGGAGGTVTKMNGQSDSATYQITAGNGGDGTKGGGAGGSVKNNNFASQTPGTDIMVVGDFVDAQGGTGGDGLQDLIVVDTSTGQMVLEENTGSGYTAVSQGSSSLINAVGATPDGAVAVDLNGDGYLDLVVSYKNSNNIGIFLNNGHGVFTSSSLSLSSSPLEVAAGNFSGDSHMDIAVIASTAAGSGAYIFQGDGSGSFTLLPTVTALGASTVTALQTIVYSNNTYGLAVGFDNGDVQVLLPTGVNSNPFSVVDDGGLALGAVTNFDVDAATAQLLVFSSSAGSVSTYGYSSNGSLTLLSTVDTSTLSGTLVKAQFVNTGGTYPSIGVLSSGVATSQLDIFTTDGTTWTDSTTLESNNVLKDFVAIGTTGDSDLAALGGTLSKFYFSETLGAFQTGALPFTGKSVPPRPGPEETPRGRAPVERGAVL
ncbi:MAG: VCBS repeat-containing protein [Chthoniobacteraceae bacterium]